MVPVEFQQGPRNWNSELRKSKNGRYFSLPRCLLEKQCIVHFRKLTWNPKLPYLRGGKSSESSTSMNLEVPGCEGLFGKRSGETCQGNGRQFCCLVCTRKCENDSLNGICGGQNNKLEVGADNSAYRGEQNLSYQCRRPFIRVK